MFSQANFSLLTVCHRGMHRIWCDTLCELIHETQIEISVFNEGSTNYRKIRGLYFSKALFEGLIFGRGVCTEGNLRFKIDWASL